MSKDVAFDLFARIDVPYEYYKDLQDTWEYQEHINLLKVYRKSDRELYKQSEKWNILTSRLNDVIEKRDEIESEIRIKNEKK